ncbi:Fe2+-dependent dioxygenase [Pseudomarimonas arenosa]|uniref:Fe2+-dependent dioxygenase n=1 Tax=Pseudomarimonas arenosa TaxID=2774145 RepID=A0AAW3ZI10_9GAMM|nr:Fe2+-dependent dioxygenase [Pseudomarimonas arenosa]MBD8525646.1 Fe2+-dependent dioxygenase [Pseudomarimonas arenosa]
MLLPIPDVLSQDDLAFCRHHLADAPWADGRITAGHQSAQVKQNLQLPQDSEAAQAMGALILNRLSAHPLFITAALPHEVFPPLFNCYREGMNFGSHIDNAIRGDDKRLRTDLSCTLFLNGPEDYDGGELLIEDYHGTQSIKLRAGSMILYPATTLHRVAPVTRGQRLASFFWVQSMIRSNEQRRLLLDLDVAIQGLRRRAGEAPELIQLSGVYHNLLRQWAEV